MIRLAVAGIAVVALAAGVAPAAAAGGAPLAQNPPLARGEVATGVLRVVTSGSIKYTLTGKGVREVARGTHSFTLTPGRYRVKPRSGVALPASVRVRPGRVARVRIVTRLPQQTVGVIGRASLDANGNEGTGLSGDAAWSPDGNQVVFVSKAPNLIPDDTNGETFDVFVKTLATGAIDVVSRNAAGEQANQGSGSAEWSPDGTKMLFSSHGTNLVANDTNAAEDIFMKTLANGAVERISTDSSGAQANLGSWAPRFSPDGTKVAFESMADNLVPDDTNAVSDAFVKDLVTGVVQRVSTDAQGGQAIGESDLPNWSPDGRQVAFISKASLVPSDTNKAFDVYVKTLATGAIKRISTASDGRQGNDDSFGFAWSPDGTRLAFNSDASNLVAKDTNGKMDVFVKDLERGTTTRVSTTRQGKQADYGSAISISPATWSPDGRELSFSSDATNLVPNDMNDDLDAFVKDLATGQVVRVSVGAQGEEGDGFSREALWSPDGKWMVLESFATNLVPEDYNGVMDVFVGRAP